MRTIAILGGGIGGLTAAIALARRGLDATVFEQAPEMRAVGAGIWLPTNAMTVMARLGLADELAAAGLPLARIEVADGARRVQAIDLGPVKARHGHTTISIRRSELQRVLAAHAPAGAVRLGARAEEVAPGEPGGAPARVRIAGPAGVEEVEADLVIGADGIHSAARAAVAPGITPRYAGQTCYRGIARLALDEQDVCREVWGGAARFGYSAVGPEEVYWFAPVVAPPGGRDEGGARRRLDALYAGFPAPVPAIVAATPEEAIGRLDLHELPAHAWRGGRVALLGDAAHAMTPNLGQGGAQAIEDAFVLAGCVAEAGEDLGAALAAYQARREARVRRIARLAGRLGRVAHWQGGLARGLRNLAMRATPAGAARRQTDALYAAGIE